MNEQEYKAMLCRGEQQSLLEAILFPTKVQSAWQQDCRHSPFAAAVYFCLPPPLNTTSKGLLWILQAKFSVSLYVWLDIFQKVTKTSRNVPWAEHGPSITSRQLKLVHVTLHYGETWDNIWCIRLWNVCLSSSPTLYICQNRYCCGYRRIKERVVTHN